MKIPYPFFTRTTIKSRSIVEFITEDRGIDSLAEARRQVPDFTSSLIRSNSVKHKTTKILNNISQ